MSMQTRIKAAVERLRDAQQEVYLLEFDEDCPQALLPPASQDDIAAVEARLGFPLPASYRAFLELHNGWLKFSGGAMVLPTSEHDEDWVAERIEDIRGNLEEFGDPTVLDDAFIVVLGQDEVDFVYLKKSTWNGQECEVVHADLQFDELGRYPDFAAFLEDQIATVEASIANLR